MTNKNTKDTKPFLKWVGGKRQLLSVLKQYIPQEFNNYYEPFTGGGAMLFDMQPTKARISDINSELINVYKVIQNNVDELINELIIYSTQNTKEDFLRIRGLDRTNGYDTLTNVQKAARFIYLNKTSFNGLHRTNRQGQFNAPYGYYENPAILDEKNLRNVHHYLSNNDIKLSVNSYANSLKDAKAGDFIFLDPPYIPLTLTASFTSYTKDKFDLSNQIELSNLMQELDQKGCFILMTNSSAELTYDTYVKGNFIADEVLAKRSVGSSVVSRAKVKELFIYNKRLQENLTKNKNVE